MPFPYHIYGECHIPQNAYTADMQYGTAFVFLVLVLGGPFIHPFATAYARNTVGNTFLSMHETTELSPESSSALPKHSEIDPIDQD